MIARALDPGGNFRMVIIVLAFGVIYFLINQVIRIFALKKGEEDHHEEKLAADMMRARETRINRMRLRWKWMLSLWK